MGCNRTVTKQDLEHILSHTQETRYDKHHIYPQKFRAFFEEKGLGNVDRWALLVEMHQHRSDAHRWNAAWEEFMDRHGDTTDMIQVAKFAIQLVEDFGYSHDERGYTRPFQPYK